MDNAINIFGDSIVHASYVEGGGWADRLRNNLEKRTDDYFRVYNLGIDGEDTDGLLKRFANENEARLPNIIIIAIGVNDSHYDKSNEDVWVPIKRFEENLLEIIDQAKNFTQEIVFVGLLSVQEEKVSPVPWNPAKYLDNKSVALYDAKIEEICVKSGLSFIKMLDLLDDSDLIDGLHPNSQGHEKMFLRIKDFLEEQGII
jgi:lysophospholipase L1-like esterase